MIHACKIKRLCQRYIRARALSLWDWVTFLSPSFLAQNRSMFYFCKLRKLRSVRVHNIEWERFIVSPRVTREDAVHRGKWPVPGDPGKHQAYRQHMCLHQPHLRQESARDIRGRHHRKNIIMAVVFRNSRFCATFQGRCGSETLWFGKVDIVEGCTVLFL